jgi:hypothetical protein
MEMIVNKVAKSGLITLDLQKFYPEDEFVEFDLKDFLFMELILKEKDFRQALEEISWDAYRGKILCVHCSTDAIIAHWAYMLVVAHASGIAKEIHFGTKASILEKSFLKIISAHDWSQYDGKKVLLKGCSDKELFPSAYLEATKQLTPFADRIMYGEACSFVPVYRRPKQ